jgi:DNA-binding NarL/FixJ family response regulator
MIKAIIIDDEPLARMIIHEYLQKENDFEKQFNSTNQTLFFWIFKCQS